MAFTQRNRRQTRSRRSGAYVKFTASNTDYTSVADNTIARFNSSAPNVTWRKYDGYIHQVGEQVTHDNPYSADMKGAAGFDSRMKGLRHIAATSYEKVLPETLNIRRLAMGGGGYGGPNAYFAGGGGGSGGAAFDSSNLSVSITGNAHRIKDPRIAGIVKAELGVVASVGSVNGDSTCSVISSNGIAGPTITGGGGANNGGSDPLGSGGGGYIPSTTFTPGSNSTPAGTGGPQGGNGTNASIYPGCGGAPSNMYAGGGGGIGPDGLGANAGPANNGGAGTDLYTLIHPGKSGLVGGGGGGGGVNGPTPYGYGDGWSSCPGRNRGSSMGNGNTTPKSPTGGGATGANGTANTGGGGGGGSINRFSQGTGGSGVVLLRLS